MTCPFGEVARAGAAASVPSLVGSAGVGPPGKPVLVHPPLRCGCRKSAPKKIESGRTPWFVLEDGMCTFGVGQ